MKIQTKILEPNPYNLVACGTHHRKAVRVVAEAKIEVTPESTDYSRMRSTIAYVGDNNLEFSSYLQSVHALMLDTMGERGVDWTGSYWLYENNTGFFLKAHYHFTKISQLSLFKLQWYE